MQILITGTSRGLGSELAAYYLDSGHEVYGISRNSNRELEKHSRFRFISQDLSKFDELEKSIPGFIEKAAPLDLVVLNAGVIAEIKDLQHTGLDEIKRVMDINVWSNKILIDLLISQEVPPKQIAAISSGASVSGNRGWNAYSLSKAALNMMIKLYASEQDQTHFCSIAPGRIDTAMQDYIYSLPDNPDFPSVIRLKQAKAAGSMPSPAEAAGALAGALGKALKKESGSFLDVRDL
jgi:benzil reductase ((S)-benzoin forming)